MESFFDKKGFKSFYKEVGFNPIKMKVDVLWALGVYGSADIRFSSREEKAAIKNETVYMTEQSAYYKHDTVGLFRILIAPIVLCLQLLLWIFQLAFLIGTLPIVILYNVKLPI